MPLLNKVLQGDVLAAAKLIRRLEDGLPDANAELKELYRHTGKAYIVGIAGAPGAGKSTLLGNLIGAFRKKKMTVGVVAVDPTSPLSGGALLGDRLRMQKHSEDKDVFIRSLASRGWKGGLSRATLNTIHVMDAMGKDMIFVEAVGSGQGEIDFASLADTSILVLVPGMGDEIQTIKAGVMEVADIFVINKSDREGTEGLKASLIAMLDMVPAKREARSQVSIHGNQRDKSPNKSITSKPISWTPRVVLTEAANDKGTDKLVKEISLHRVFLSKSRRIEERRRSRAKLELMNAVENGLREHLTHLDGCYLEQLITDLADRRTDPHSAANQVIKLPPAFGICRIPESNEK